VDTNENVFISVNNLIIMSQSITTFIEEVAKKNPNEPEFLQAVLEVAETVIPFIEKNKKYQNKMLLERMVESDRIIIKGQLR
jgi:glutamate dehydrogenase (NADP+)